MPVTPLFYPETIDFIDLIDETLTARDYVDTEYTIRILV